MGSSIGTEWTVEWAAPLPNDDGCYDNLVLSQEQAQAYGDELVLSLRVDDEILQKKGSIRKSRLRGRLTTES